MPLYEHVFIARQDVSSAQVDTMVDEFTQLLEAQDGSVKKKEYWGLRTLAYRIKKNRKGHYVLLNVDASSDALLELERIERLHEDVLRYLSLRVDAHEDAPSIMMQSKRDRGDRRGDRDSRGPRPEPRGETRAAKNETAKPAAAEKAPDKEPATEAAT